MPIIEYPDEYIELPSKSGESPLRLTKKVNSQTGLSYFSKKIDWKNPDKELEDVS